MQETIHTILKDIEETNDCRVLFAVESGSRAWGLASKDSDYDVRFVYAHRVSWYLSLGEQRDTIERFYPGDVDCAGWEVRKALRLFAGCNIALCEWLGSPTVYRDEADFLAALQELSPAYFNPQKAMHHYLGTARNTYENFLTNDGIGIKKLFYILRPLAAATWIGEHGTMAPVPFTGLLDAGVLPEATTEEVRALQQARGATNEADRVRISDTLRGWIDAGFARLPHEAHATTPGKAPGWEPLNRLFRQAIGAETDRA